MAKPQPPRRHAAKPLRWRKTRISEWREAAGLTQQQLADALGERGIDLDRVSIVRIEGGKQMPSIGTLEAIADILGTDLDSLLNHSPAQAAELRALRQMPEADRARLFRILKAVGEV